MPPTAAALERTMRIRDVILQVVAGKLMWIQAAEVLGVSDRTMRRYRWRIEQNGFEGLYDGRRVDRARNAVPVAELKRWVSLYARRYRGYNVRHFVAVLRRQGWALSREPIIHPTTPAGAVA